jgi:hypothetical protein
MKREYVKDNINELETDNKDKNIRVVCRGKEVEKNYQPGINLVKS